jgi:cobalt/nickel transport protein
MRWIISGIVVILILVAVPLVIIQDSEFGGSDGAGSEVVEQIAPDYDSQWATNWWEPPGGETESALFAIQAAVGGILIGYGFGFLRGRKKGRAELAKDR